MTEWIAKILSVCTDLFLSYDFPPPSFLFFGEEPLPSPEEE